MVVVSKRSAAAQRRRDEILSLVRAQDFVGIKALSDRFGVSLVTVRGDLDELADKGDVRRIRGGAVAAYRQASEMPFEARRDAHAAEKVRIARAAVDLLKEDDTVLLDVGTTTMAIAREIVARSDLEHLTLVTHGLNIAHALEPAIPRIQVLVTGGALRPVQHSLVDPMGGLMLERLRATIAFIGADGVHPVHGVSTTNPPEAEMKQRLIAAAQRCVVVVDGSKFAQEALVRVCDLQDVDLVITAGEVDPPVLSAISEHVEVLVPEGNRNPRWDVRDGGAEPSGTNE
jgi:DeoR family transcriptional regulator of aga operon